MHKSTYHLLLLFYAIGSFAQTERTLVSGTIKNQDNDLKGVHVINKTSNQGTVTNDNGLFAIPVQPNDTLVFRGIQFEQKEIIITQNDVALTSIQVELTTKTNILKEISLKKPENMAMALNLPNAGKKPLKGVDRKLAYYSQESTPVVILGMLLGQKGGIEDLYNIISGNRKKHRKLKKLIEEDKQKEHDLKVSKAIRKHFKDDFFIYTLKIPSKKIDNFIAYCQPKDIIHLFDKESYLEIIDVFIKESKPFLKDLKDEK